MNHARPSMLSTLRAKAILGAVVVLLVSASLLVILLRSSAGVNRAADRAMTLDAVSSDIFSLAQLTSDFLLHDNDRARRQWMIQHERLDESLRRLAEHYPNNKLELSRMKAELEASESLFENLVEVQSDLEQGRGDAGALLQSRLRIGDRLDASCQSMAAEAFRLHDVNAASIASGQRATRSVVTLVVVTVSSILLIGLLVISRQFVAPVARLRVATQALAAGDLDHRVPIEGHTELADLAASFNLMASTLSESRTALEQEVVDRRRAQEELQTYRDQLEHTVEERTAELVVANEELGRAMSAKSEFLAAMSHELRTPLNSIIGFSGILLGGLAGPLNEEQTRQVDMVNRSGKHLLSLINDVLDLSKIEAGRIALDLDYCPVTEIVRSSVEAVEPMAREKALSVVVEPHVPLTIWSDAGKVQQILLNLLSNAVKFTDEGSIRISVAQEQDWVRVRVSDTGKGIRPEDMEHLFEQFTQFHTRDSAKPQGTGLGLALSRQLAQALGGDIEAESMPGAGSTFTLTLPMVHPSQDGANLDAIPEHERDRAPGDHASGGS